MRLIDADKLHFSPRFAPADPDSNNLVPVYAVDQREIDEAPTVEAEPVRRWIPCSERLPEDAGKYLVCIASEAFPGSMYVGILQYFKKRWKQDCVYVANVTHWQPLPEPPEEGGIENGLD